MKTNFRKTCAWVLALVMVCVAPLAAVAEEMVTFTPFEAVRDDVGLQEGTQLVVGSTTPMSGHFGTDAWSANTADMDARALLHGYNIISWTRAMGATVNSAVVEDIQTTTEADGSRIYTIYLQNDLYYSEGTPLTAKDYVFSVLLGGSAALQQLGGALPSMDHIVGYEAYAAGTTNTVQGVRLLSDLSFSIQMKSEALPFFYGLAMLNITPYPPSALAPGCEVMDDGQGVYLSSELTADTLTDTMLHPQTGYEFAPYMTTGPYRLESYNVGKKEAVFVVNTYYKGNYEGVKPHIERLVYRQVTNEEAIQLLEDGEVDLLNKISAQDVIDNGRELVYDGGFQTEQYMRSGMAYLSFACETGVTADPVVRRAIAMCMDVDALVQEVGPDAIRRVYGHYGLGQWMPTYFNNGSDGGEPVDMAETLPELAVEHNANAAGVLLESAGWALNAQGDSFVAGQDDQRYRREGDTLVPLTIRWAKTEGSAMADRVEAILKPAMAQAGIRLEVFTTPFGEMMEHFFRQQPRMYDMFFLATNFSYVYDPYYEFSTDERFQGAVNTTGLKDGQLMDLALAMRTTKPYDMRAYVEKWHAFQQRLVEQMPIVPLYSSAYADFYADKLMAYDVSTQPGWGYAIVYAYLDGE